MHSVSVLRIPLPWWSPAIGPWRCSWPHTARGLLIPRPWVDHPYGEEEITLLEEELLPAMAGFLERVEAIDQAIEADHEAEVAAHQAAAAAGLR